MIDVPCKDVKTILRLLRFILSDNVPFLTDASINALSIFFPTTSIKFSFALKLISEKSTAFTLPIIPLSCGGTIWPPSAQYTLYPLYSGGLWEAVNTIPASHPKWRTAKDNSGVGRKSSNKNTLILLADKTSATILANFLLLCLQS